MAADKDCVIRYGNVWLMTDEMQTEIKWVDERALASRHTLEWAEKFKQQVMVGEHKMVDVITFAEAIKIAESDRNQRLRASYFYAFEAEIRRLAPDTDFYIKGVGCASYCFGVDPAFYGQVPVKKAAAAWLKAYTGRKKKKRKAA